MSAWLRPISRDSPSKEDGWSNLAEVGSYLSKSHAAFDPRDYGHAKLGELARAQPYVEINEVAGPTGLSQLWVRLRPTGGTSQLGTRATARSRKAEA